MNFKATRLFKFAVKYPTGATLRASQSLINGNVPAASHSTEASVQKLEDEIKTKKMILEAALLHTPTLGWKKEALVAGVNDLGYPSATAGMFSRGPIELVEYAMMKWNSQLREDLVTSKDFANMSTVSRVHHGLKLRLSYEIPYLTTWSEAMTLGAIPPNVLTTTKQISDFCDEIWFRAGDRSSDLSWFTKRMALAGIFVNAEIFMLTDTSPQYEATWTLLEQRVHQSLAASAALETAGEIAASVGGGLLSIPGILRSPRPTTPESLAELQQKYGIM